MLMESKLRGPCVLAKFWLKVTAIKVWWVQWIENVLEFPVDVPARAGPLAAGAAGEVADEGL